MATQINRRDDTDVIAGAELLAAPAVEVNRLTKTYPGGIEAVKGIDFRVGHGEVFGLLGPNGAGKSTTIGMLTTTIAPTSGTAKLAGFDVARQPLAARRLSSVVFQEPVVDRSLTGRRHLDLHARLWGVDERQAGPRVAELAGTLGLTELVDRPVGTYSGGERRRLEIARALVSSPRVLFLDEPTVNASSPARPRLRSDSSASCACPFTRSSTISRPRSARSAAGVSSATILPECMIAIRSQSRSASSR
jgi:ATPase subunit of ABC transporter with duplicated ATPase domains